MIRVRTGGDDETIIHPVCVASIIRALKENVPNIVNVMNVCSWAAIKQKGCLYNGVNMLEIGKN